MSGGTRNLYGSATTSRGALSKHTGSMEIHEGVFSWIRYELQCSDVIGQRIHGSMENEAYPLREVSFSDAEEKNSLKVVCAWLKRWIRGSFKPERAKKARFIGSTKRERRGSAMGPWIR